MNIRIVREGQFSCLIKQMVENLCRVSLQLFDYIVLCHEKETHQENNKPKY